MNIVIVLAVVILVVLLLSIVAWIGRIMECVIDLDRRMKILEGERHDEPVTNIVDILV